MPEPLTAEAEKIVREDHAGCYPPNCPVLRVLATLDGERLAHEETRRKRDALREEHAALARALDDVTGTTEPCCEESDDAFARAKTALAQPLAAAVLRREESK